MLKKSAAAIALLFVFLLGLWAPVYAADYDDPFDVVFKGINSWAPLGDAVAPQEYRGYAYLASVPIVTPKGAAYVWLFEKGNKERLLCIRVSMNKEGELIPDKPSLHGDQEAVDYVFNWFLKHGTRANSYYYVPVAESDLSFSSARISAFSLPRDAVLPCFTAQSP